MCVCSADVFQVLELVSEHVLGSVGLPHPIGIEVGQEGLLELVCCPHTGGEGGGLVQSSQSITALQTCTGTPLFCTW